jgi:hypothetical protein
MQRVKRCTGEPRARWSERSGAALLRRAAHSGLAINSAALNL